MIIRNACNLDEDQKQLIDKVLSPAFPWYYQSGSDEYHMFFAHALIVRDCENKPVNGTMNSEYVHSLMSIFHCFCRDNNIKVDTVFRAAVNLTLCDQGSQTATIHVDHDFDHNVFVFYMNDFDDGATLLYDDDNNLIHRIEPKKFDAVVFSTTPHSIEFCKPKQRRVALIVTFK